jgi:hypothetical protein
VMASSPDGSKPPKGKGHTMSRIDRLVSVLYEVESAASRDCFHKPQVSVGIRQIILCA